MAIEENNYLKEFVDEMKFRWMVTEVSYSKWAASFGLTLNELWLLWLLSGKENGLKQSDLVLATSMSKQIVSYVIKQLERRGLVERGVETQDKRGRTAKITKKGEDMFRPILKEIDEAGMVGLQEFSVDEQQLFVKMYTKYIEEVISSFSRFAMQREGQKKAHTEST